MDLAGTGFSNLLVRVVRLPNCSALVSTRASMLLVLISIESAPTNRFTSSTLCEMLLLVGAHRRIELGANTK